MKVWIARDADGGLFMYNHKPQRMAGFFMIEGDADITKGNWPIPEDHLTEVTWENSPQEFFIEINCYKLKAQIKKGGVK